MPGGVVDFGLEGREVEAAVVAPDRESRDPGGILAAADREQQACEGLLAAAVDHEVVDRHVGVGPAQEERSGGELAVIRLPAGFSSPGTRWLIDASAPPTMIGTSGR